MFRSASFLKSGSVNEQLASSVTSVSAAQTLITGSVTSMVFTIKVQSLLFPYSSVTVRVTDVVSLITVPGAGIWVISYVLHSVMFRSASFLKSGRVNEQLASSVTSVSAAQTLITVSVTSMVFTIKVQSSLLPYSSVTVRITDVVSLITVPGAGIWLMV